MGIAPRKTDVVSPQNGYPIPENTAVVELPCAGSPPAAPHARKAAASTMKCAIMFTQMLRRQR